MKNLCKSKTCIHARRKLLLILYGFQHTHQGHSESTYGLPRHICHCVPVGNTLVYKHRGLQEFNPRYRQIQSGLDDYLKWWSSVIGSYLH